MEPIKQYDKPDPKDSLDDDGSTEEEVDHAIDRWDQARSKEVHVESAGSITNMESHNRPTVDAREVTDPFDEEGE